MTIEEFITYIESIGFIYEEQYSFYRYKCTTIDIVKIKNKYVNKYIFDNRLHDLNNLTALDKYFKKEIRSIKLKMILE